MKVLMLLTSHDQLGNTGRKTGFWLEEMAAPYYVFKEAGAQITLASPKGGRPPLDPKFTNGEEEDVGLTKVVPFLVEDELLNLGPHFPRLRIGAFTRSSMVS
jgi:putative intracellular protease/amidase